MTDINDEKKRLEEIIAETGENEHLTQLLLLRSKNKKGASADDLMNNVIHPTLEDLEFYIRYYTTEDMDKETLKLLISKWIDAQIAKTP